MPNLEEYTDEELGQMFRQALKNEIFEKREKVSFLDAFCSWLNLVGLGFVADAIKVTEWVYERIRSIFQRIFR